jgi:3-polyprenyl-4-hydroxybenzoate decarboxylase
VASRIVVAVTGSSAPQLGLTALQALREVPDLEVHLVISTGAVRSIEAEMGVSPVVFEELADVVHAPQDMGAAISSGSFRTRGTVMPPVPAFYHRPQTIEDLLRQTAGKVLDQFDLPHRLFRRWEGMPEGVDAAH